MVAPSVSELLAPVLWSAADLVLAPATAPLRCCANPQCRWLFLDTSKGATRRWCAMSACGNRAKVRRHAQRQRARRPD
jgi:predicted RNA-binding Zn ribbon-like protein